MPAAGTIVATAGKELAHVPPDESAVLSVVVPPVQIDVLPKTAAKLLTDTVAVVVQCAVLVKVMTEVPADSPLMAPENVLIPTTAVFPLAHVPPAPALSVAVAPPQRAVGPTMAGGEALTVTVNTEEQALPDE